MSRPVTIALPGSTAGPGFEQPFGMLEACHVRAQRTLDLLARLRAHLASHGADEQAQQAARDILRYFDQAAPQHHHDEELHVFPPLLAAGDPQVMAVVRRLQDEHLQMESGWQRARRLLAAVAEGRLAAFLPDDEAALDRFATLYAGHIEAEEQVAYPAAQALLDAATVRAMGEEMARRRGAK